MGNPGCCLMKVARFKLELKDGLREAYIIVDNVYLPTTNNECAEYFADDDESFNLMWRMAGPTGSSLEVTMRVGAGSPKTIVKCAMPSSANEMYVDTNTIKLK